MYNGDENDSLCVASNLYLAAIANNTSLISDEANDVPAVMLLLNKNVETGLQL